MTKQEKIREGIMVQVLAWYEDLSYGEAQELLLRYKNSYDDGSIQEVKGVRGLADKIMLQESSQGLVIKVELPCSRCNGSGSIETGVLRSGVFKGNDVDCPDCRGTGKAGYVLESIIKEGG